MEIKDIENLAELAKLDLTQLEKESLLRDLDGILAYVKQVSEAETDDIPDEYIIKNIWREDEAAPKNFSREELISQFPDSQDGFVKVKKIL